MRFVLKSFHLAYTGIPKPPKIPFRFLALKGCSEFELVAAVFPIPDLQVSNQFSSRSLAFDRIHLQSFQLSDQVNSSGFIAIQTFKEFAGIRIAIFSIGSYSRLAPIITPSEKELSSYSL